MSRPRAVACQPEKRKVGTSTLPLTTSFGLVPSALTSANADLALSCLQPPSDHDYPYVTVVGRSLSHADPRRASVLRIAALSPELTGAAGTLTSADLQVVRSSHLTQGADNVHG
jgi:hypothetical protein